jgi:hypothetical protein
MDHIMKVYLEDELRPLRMRYTTWLLEGKPSKRVAGRETFKKTTRKFATHVSEEYPSAWEYQVGMVDMKMNILAPPECPQNPNNQYAFVWWKDSRKEYLETKARREKVVGQIFATRIGQCSQALCNQMEAHEDWKRVNAEDDVNGLLGLIKTSMTLGRNLNNKIPIQR